MQGVSDDNLAIREVWAENLEEEMALIRNLIDDFPFVAMDTEFPGVVAKPVGNFKNTADYYYQTLRCNVDMLNLIQLGLTFANAEGEIPRCGPDGQFCIWQFNFREFDLDDDLYAEDSIELLKDSGIDFEENRTRGMSMRHFAELLTVSGIVLNDKVSWVTFHSSYDFAYLLKLLTCQSLPKDEDEFQDLIQVFFPNLYDIKYLMKFCDSLHGGLNRLAEVLELKNKYFNGGSSKGAVERYVGVLYGMNRDGLELHSNGDI